MTLKSMVMEFGMGTDIRGGDHTKAAVRALENTLRQNSITFAQAFDLPREAMRVQIAIGVAKPEAVDKSAIAAVLPYGTAEVTVVKGGLDIPRDGGEVTVMANAAVTVYLDLPDREPAK
ncbi:MAG: Lin0512 family protein [Pseudomonadota bacterium]